MGIYRREVLPRLIDIACGSPAVGKWRARCVEGLAGVVVEPGFGSGTNVAHYPLEVTQVYAVDPAVVGQKLAADRLTSSSVPVDFIGLDGQSIPLEDDSCDAGLLTFSLCTIPDPGVALGELARVIKPGGSLHFLEHGMAPTPQAHRRQRGIDPVQSRLFDGCHLSRDILGLIGDAGFNIEWSDQRYEGPNSPWSFFYVGRATWPGTGGPVI